tara:strand:+ start:8228 stop:9184 length:957 start_codon:yes stop_codon:yes gene_type:complete
MNIFKAENHPIPIICIGNLSAGGSGKTPHTNYIANLLNNNYKVAILSRGYGRRTSGFHYVDTESNATNIGDEPLELKQNNPNCIVAVNNNRNKGVKRILKDYPDLDVIVLDDGFQHRWIKAGLSIIVSPFYKPYYKDKMLPLGNLREHKNGANRSDIIIISKTPKETNPKEEKEILASISLKAHQKAYFSSIKYENIKCIYTNEEFIFDDVYNIILVTGIADAKPLIKHLEKGGHYIHQIQFNDHHKYTESDIQKILIKYNTNQSLKKLILTTEKDATKLREFLIQFKGLNFYYAPIKIKFEQQREFDRQIINYVAKN